jgi:hypothetical protein
MGVKCNARAIAAQSLRWSGAMQRGVPARERRTGRRLGFRVAHRHRVGSSVVERVSELLYVKGRPVAVLGWVNLGGIRTPLYVCELDAEKLHPGDGGVFRYDDVTADPRFPDNPPDLDSGSRLFVV